MFMQRIIDLLFHRPVPPPPPTAVQKEFVEAADRLTKESQKLSSIISGDDDPLGNLARNMRGEVPTRRKRKVK